MERRLGRGLARRACVIAEVEAGVAVGALEGRPVEQRVAALRRFADRASSPSKYQRSNGERPEISVRWKAASALFMLPPVIGSSSSGKAAREQRSIQRDAAQPLLDLRVECETELDRRVAEHAARSAWRSSAAISGFAQVSLDAYADVGEAHRAPRDAADPSSRPRSPLPSVNASACSWHDAHASVPLSESRLS